MLVVLFLGTFGYVCYFSSVLGVRTVRVDGAKTVSTKEITDVAQVPLGDPMLRVDTTTIADRVVKIPRVAGAEVVRSWPSTMLITVTERTPVVMLRAPDGIKLVDNTGFAYATVPTPPSGLPELVVGTVGPSDPATQAALHVFLGLPDKLRAEVLGITAPTPGDVNLTLSAGRQVRWGADDQPARKAATLQALLSQQGKVYNVQSPDAPAVS